MTRPRIGITVTNRDNSAASGQYESACAYSRAVAAAGGLPLLLPQEIPLVRDYVRACDGLVFTGGADLCMEKFGGITHPSSRLIDPQRQAFETALLDALQQHLDKPVLGVCLGMQHMAMHAGGSMHQHLPEVLADAAIHQHDNRHRVMMETLNVPTRLLASGANDVNSPMQTVVSSHRQAVSDAGKLRVIARSPDHIIEAIDDPQRAFYVGVQWHPERGGQGLFNSELFAQLVFAAAAAAFRAAT